MGINILYRRPSYVRSDTSSSSTLKDDASRPASVSSGSSVGGANIPPGLSFDRIIAGGTCPPCTARDFMNYLLYVEHAAENLQFYLWLRSYIQRFAQLPDSQRLLSSPVLPDKDDPDATVAIPKLAVAPATRQFINDVLKTTGFDQAPVVTEKPSASSLDVSTPDADTSTTVLPWEDEKSTHSVNPAHPGARSHWRQATSQAYEAADVKIQPFTVQPFREEISRIIATYLSEDAPRELNLASRLRKDLLRDLAVTTHPSAFAAVMREVEWSLRYQAHPNFIRWTIRNGNAPRVGFARFLGIAGIVAGIVMLVLLTISGLPRAWRALAAIPLVIGTSTLWAGWCGMCVVLHGMHHRQLKPWELFVDAEAPSCGAMPAPETIAPSATASQLSMSETVKPTAADVAALEKETSPSYEDAPWVACYQRRSFLRRLFDRQVRIQEPALRQIQDSIFFQALLIALTAAAVLVGVFCAIPPGYRF